MKKNTTLHLAALGALVLGFLTCAGTAQANDISGTYQSGSDGKAPKRLFYVKKVDTDKYTVTTNDWVSTAYYDKNEDIYKAVFRYKDFTAEQGGEFGKGGSKENAVGFHLYEITENGGLKVTFQWGRSAYGGQGTFLLDKVK